LWWGFKKNPELQIKARPKVGQKEIQMTKIVEFIEKKLIQEFQVKLIKFFKSSSHFLLKYLNPIPNELR